MVSDEPVNTKYIVPAKPIVKPMPVLKAMFCLKNNKPTSSTNRGVKALRIPVSALVSWVSAIAKRKAGKKFPRSPHKNNSFQCRLLMLPSLGMAIGNRKRQAAITRIAPTSPPENTTNPFLIKIKELPHTNESPIKSAHGNQGFSLSC